MSDNTITLTLAELFEATQAGKTFAIANGYPVVITKDGEKIDYYHADMESVLLSGHGGTVLSCLTETSAISRKKAEAELRLKEYVWSRCEWCTIDIATPSTAEAVLARNNAVEPNRELRFENAEGKVVPVVGVGVTRSIGSDSYAGTIVKVSPSGHQFTMRDDIAQVVKGTEQDGSAEYIYLRNSAGCGAETVFSRRRDGSYIQAGSSYGRANIGIRRTYRDPSF
jgi:hypothetical protein